jgi:DNA-binding NtrC family response regulator/iron only hydrogenase large subunit-like protein
VRSCPVKAIKVERSHAEIIYERCIGCGNCLACPQKAKVVTDKVGVTEEFLAGPEKVLAVLGCSFPAFFNTLRPGQLVAGLKELGFAEVHEGAYGAELIADSYARAIEEAGHPLISSHCPAVVDLIERHYPKLIQNLVGVVSPMVAMGRFLKGVHGGGVRVVYLSSCIAAKFEAQADEARGAIDLLLTYRELEGLFRSRGIQPATLTDRPFDGISPRMGRLFPISGGSFAAFAIASDPLETQILTAEGEGNTLGTIRDMASGRIQPRIADLRFCYGACIGGPGKRRELTELYKRNQVIAHFKVSTPYATLPHYRQTTFVPELSRKFTSKHATLPVPKPSDIRSILRAADKFAPEDELNCRACGYRTCRDYAVAVFQGLAEIEMCLPHNLQQLQEERGRLIQKYELARRELDREYGDEFMVGSDSQTRGVLELIKQVGPTPTTVLIRGESGTGKELTARAIHRHSLRNDKPLVTLNCTTLTDSLLESELFGHRKGAFTGAIADKKGLFEAADSGTIFLDEIGDITPKLQAELLRVLDSGEVRPVGGTTARKVDVRLIAATNKNLEQGVRDGWFREDLYYRLNVFSITMPPLRNRRESIPVLADHFLDKARIKLNKGIEAVEERAVAAMMRYHWPGNIRELQNVIERAAVLTQDGVIRLEQLPVIFAERYAEGTTLDPGTESASLRLELERQVSRTEKGLLLRYLAESSGNVSRAAELANIPRRTFYRLLAKYGVTGRSVKEQLRGDRG